MTANEKIAELLDWSGMSQQALADALGIPRTTVSNYITGRTPVSVETAYKIADALGVTPWTVLNCEPLPATPLDLTADEAAAIGMARGLPRKERALLAAILNYMDAQNKET